MPNAKDTGFTIKSEIDTDGKLLDSYTVTNEGQTYYHKTWDEVMAIIHGGDICDGQN